MELQEVRTTPIQSKGTRHRKPGDFEPPDTTKTPKPEDDPPSFDPKGRKGRGRGKGAR